MLSRVWYPASAIQIMLSSAWYQASAIQLMLSSAYRSEVSYPNFVDGTMSGRGSKEANAFSLLKRRLQRSFIFDDLQNLLPDRSLHSLSVL